MSLRDNSNDSGPDDDGEHTKDGSRFSHITDKLSQNTACEFALFMTLNGENIYRCLGDEGGCGNADCVEQRRIAYIHSDTEERTTGNIFKGEQHLCSFGLDSNNDGSWIWNDSA